LEQRLSLEDYSVSNRGLRSGLVGTPERVLEQVRAFEAAGVDLLLLQCSPQHEEMQRFGHQVIAPHRRATRNAGPLDSTLAAAGAVVD
jgi:dimethylsulfone monooxygenase